VLQYLGLVVLIAGMIIGSLMYKKLQPGEYLTYGQSFTVNFLIGLYATIISVIFYFFYVKFINTGLIQEMLEMARNKMEAKGNLSSDQIDQAMNMTQKFMSPIGMMLWGLVGNAFFSAIFALIIAIFVRKNNPDAPKMI